MSDGASADGGGDIFSAEYLKKRRVVTVSKSIFLFLHFISEVIIGSL